MIFRVLVFLCFFAPNIVFSQYWLGISSSNYAGTNSLSLNPSNVVDSRFRLYTNIVGNDIFLINNYLSYDAPYSFLSLATNTVSNKYRNENGLIIWKDSYYAEKLNGKPKDIHIGGDVRGPSFQYNSKDNKTGFALTSRWRYQLDLTDVSEETARIIRFGTDPEEFHNQPYSGQKAELSTNGFLEIGATFGKVMIDNEEDFWKAGITLKRLVGMFNTHAQLQNADFRILPLNVPANREIILTSNLQGNYGFTTDDATKFKLTPNWLFGSASAGGGWGLDVGFSYEYRPDISKFKVGKKGGGRHADPEKNKYKYRISAALNDVGYIKYKNPNQVRKIDVSANTVTFSYVIFDGQNNTGAAVGAVNKTLNIRPEENSGAYTVLIPTTANVSFDYHYDKFWYINARWIQGLRGSSSLNITPLSALAITPRYERKWLEVAMPIALIDNYSTVSVGLGARIGPLIVGTDHLGAMLNIGNPRGLDFYFGLYLPLFHAKPEDPNKCYYVPYEKVKRRKK